MLNNRFFILKKPKPAYVYYHYDSLFQGDFSQKFCQNLQNSLK